jgi:DNA-binding LytR/AlgR family response regulator
VTTAILVDDEPNLCVYLQEKLAEVWPDLEIEGIAHNGRQALALAAQYHPDLVFLDIHMPGLSGLQVAEQLPDDVRVVFVTAFDHYAVDAFERAALDYLLKPVTSERLQKTMVRLQEQRDADVDIQSLLAHLKDPAQTAYLQWLRAGKGDKVVLVPIDDVVYFRADHKYTSVMTAREEYIVRKSVKELENELDPQKFWRVHRSLIVNVAEVAEARRDLRGRYALKLKSRPDSLRTSQAYGHLFRQM